MSPNDELGAGGPGEVEMVGDEEAPNAGAGGGRAAGARPRHMVHSMRCPDCRRAWQVGGGEAIEISPDAIARIECDAVVVDDESGGRAAWTISPATRRTVMMRDHARCQFPGCRAARFLDVHHIIHRAHGGTNDEWNLIVLCAGHHRLHHEGIVEIGGRAPDQMRFERAGVELQTAQGHIRQLGDREVEPARRVSNENVRLAADALTTAGYKAAMARRAVEAARAHVGTDSLPGLIKAALRECLR